MAKNSAPAQPAHAITIYQQRDYVRGILQQAYSQGVLTSSTTSTEQRATSAALTR